MDMDSMSGMDMGMSATSSAAATTATSSSSSSSSSMDMMTMVFHTSTNDPLFASGWTPSSTGKYAGTCIFLIVLAVTYRLTHVIKHRTERYLISRATHIAISSHIHTVDDDGAIEKYTASTSSISKPLSFGDARPWRVSIDFPMAAIQVILAGTSYLLMLAVMTFNVGYFLSVLGGIFLGELVLGRFAGSVNAH
ncbi:Ctr copper transporter family-domain-containing protein [Lipomyces japonicus]|uniref:Ctr copper transporter family-domain-containing protein n=1 Tax=Lipomyces japonicus TaxID=56871 RepID=UPI0034CE4A4F